MVASTAGSSTDGLSAVAGTILAARASHTGRADDLSNQRAILCAQKQLYVVGRSLTGQWQLGHTISSEVRPLPPARVDLEWEVDDNNVEAYVTNGDVSLWCQPMFTWGLYMFSHDESLILRSADTKERVPTNEWLQRAIRCSCLFHRKFLAATSVQATVFKNSLDGDRIWWSLDSIYTSFGFGSRNTAERWYNNAWGSWRRALYSWQVDADAGLRKAMEYRNGDSPLTIGNDFVRCLDHATVGTHALLVLLVRWTFFNIGQGGLRGGASTAGSLLRAFLDKLEFEDWEFMLCWDSAVRRVPLVGVIGRYAFLVRSTYGGVHIHGILDRLRGERLTELEEQLRTRAEGHNTIDMYGLLEVLGRSRCPIANIIVQQVVWACAARTETLLLESLAVEKGCGALPIDAGLAEEDPFGDTGEGRGRRVAACSIASRMAFGAGDLNTMSATFDMSSVAGRRTGAGAVANKDNVALITPPQVRDRVGQWPHTTRVEIYISGPTSLVKLFTVEFRLGLENPNANFSLFVLLQEIPLFSVFSKHVFRV